MAALRPRAPEAAEGAVPRVSVHAADFGARVRESLAATGVCIVSGVASKEELEVGEELFWRWAEGLKLGFRREDHGTLDNSHFRKLGFVQSGVLNEYSIGQSKFLWFCRMLPGVRKVFETVWETRELATSFDGCGVARNPYLPFELKPKVAKVPAAKVDRVRTRVEEAVVADYAEGAAAKEAKTEDDAAEAAGAGAGDGEAAKPAEDETAEAKGDEASASASAEEDKSGETDKWLCRGEWLTKGGWYHLDQSGISKPKFDLWQGLLNFFPSNAHSGTTVVVLNTHHEVFTRVFRDKQHKKNRNPFVLLNKPGDYEKYCSEAVQVTLQAGDFLLWDSRTIHCNQGVDEEHKASEVLPGREYHPLARLVAYICMVPKERLEEKHKEHRRNMVLAGCTGSHQPLQEEWMGRAERAPKSYNPPKKGAAEWHLV